MDKINCFLTPEVRKNVLRKAINGGLEEAKRQGIKVGVIVVSIEINGEYFIEVEPFNGDYANGYDIKKSINYFGDAMSKLAQSIRIIYSSKTEIAEHGESYNLGSCCEVCSCKNNNGEDIQFTLQAAYSGAAPEENFYIAHAAYRRAINEMSNYTNSDDSDTGIKCVSD